MPDNIIVFVDKKQIKGSGLRLLKDGGQSPHVELPAEQVKENLQRFTALVVDMIPSAAQKQGGFQLESFDVAVGVDGSGRVGFLGTGVEAKASATLKLTFKRG